jgi:hypothetical protein
MGPDEICLEMARFILNAHPNIAVDEIELGYAISDAIDSNWEPMMAGENSCDQFAALLRAKFNWLDDDKLLGLTIQDFVDKIETGDNVSE